MKCLIGVLFSITDLLPLVFPGSAVSKFDGRVLICFLYCCRKMLSYNDKTIPLIPTDLNRLESKSHAGSIEGKVISMLPISR